MIIIVKMITKNSSSEVNVVCACVSIVVERCNDVMVCGKMKLAFLTGHNWLLELNKFFKIVL